MKFLADAADQDAVGGGSSRLMESLDRLQIRLTAELKRLMMHGDEPVGIGIVAHLPGLLRRAMCTNPRIVSPNRHDRQVDRSRSANHAKLTSDRRIAGKQDSISPRLD